MRKSVWAAASIQALEGQAALRTLCPEGEEGRPAWGVFKLLSGTHGDCSAVERGGTQGLDSAPQPETFYWLSKGTSMGPAFKGRSR